MRWRGWKEAKISLEKIQIKNVQNTLYRHCVCVCVSKKRGFIEANILQSIMKLTSCCEREKASMIFFLINAAPNKLWCNLKKHSSKT